MDHDIARLRALFDEIIQASPEDRPRLLDARCKADTKLRHRIEALIATAEAQDPFLSSPTHTASTQTSQTLSEVPGERIGPYKLLQQIGEGGFGVVFMAEQDQPVRRRVALKIIKLGMDTRQVVARFEQERQALALMDHPNIARVLDAGATGSGRPYFVMEYVKGDPITEFADAHKLSVAERLGLFSQVCAAVQHAHTKGVIHRDLKPRNVLVSMSDGRPFAKVIDFGIAKATGARLTEKTLFTEHRQLIGTPEYMSPEQAEGSPDIDTRTDVYSLGVLLYELLTGATPFDGARLRSAAYGEMQRIIREEDPPAPSVRLSRDLSTLAAAAAARQAEPAALGGLVKGELDWIVMKAMEKDRARRYESPNQLAADVRRHLSGEAVEAAPPSAGYRLRKLVRRHRRLVVAGTGVAAALMLGISGTTWQWWRADQANHHLRDANVQLREETTRARLAEATNAYTYWALRLEHDLDADERREADRGLGAVVSTNAELRGPDHLETIKAEWMRTVATRDAGDHDDAAWWAAVDPSFDALARRLDGAGGEADAELADWYGRALAFAFARLDADAAILWAQRSGKAMTALLDAQGRGAASGPYRRLEDVFPAARGSEITTSMIEEMARRMADLRPAQVLGLMATSMRADDTGTPTRWDSLAEMARACLANSPDDPDALTALAVAQLRLNALDDATQTATLAAAKAAEAGVPASPAPSAVIAMCMKGLGRLEESRAELLRARSFAEADLQQQSSCAGILADAVDLIDPQPTTEQRLAAEVATRRAAEYRENITVASLAVGVGDVVTTRNRLEACDPGIRGWEWRYLVGRTETSLRVLDDGDAIVYTARFSPDGTRVATGYRADRYEARIWDAATGRLVATLPAPGGSNTVAFSPDGDRALVCGLGSAVVWNIADQRRVLTLPVIDSGSCDGAFSPDGERILTWQWARPPQVWDARTGDLIVTLPLEMNGERAKHGLGEAAFSADGTRVITAHFNHVRIWDAATGELQRTLTCESEQARDIEVSTDGRSIIGFGFNNAVTVWDATTGEVRATLTLKGDVGGVDAAFSPDGAFVVTSGYHRGVQVWNAATGALVRDFPVDHPEGWHSARISPDNAWVVVWGVGTPTVFAVATGERLRNLVGHADEVLEAQFSPDGSILLTASQDGSARLWETCSERNPKLLQAQREPVLNLQFSNDGQRLLSVGYNEWRVWETESYRAGSAFSQTMPLIHGRGATFTRDGRVLSWMDAVEIHDPSGGAVAATILPASERRHSEDVGDFPSAPVFVASVGGTRALLTTRHAVHLANTEAGTLDLQVEIAGCRQAELSPDGQRALAVIFDESIVRVFDTETGATLFELPGQIARFDPTGTRILTLSRNNRGARVWDARTGNLVSVLDLPTDQWNLPKARAWEIWQNITPRAHVYVFSPDGTRVVLPDADWEALRGRSAYVYDVESGRRIAELRADFRGSPCIAFSPDSQRIATGRWVDPDGIGLIRDPGIRIWDASSGAQLLHLPVPSRDGYGTCSLAWSPDGARLAAGGYDGQISIFEAPAPGEPTDGP